MSQAQPGILSPLPALARHLFFELTDAEQARPALASLASVCDGVRLVAGLGASLVAALGAAVPGLTTFPALSGPGVDVPSTPSALWCWLRGGDPGELFHRARTLEAQLAPAFTLTQAVDSFRYGSGLDLTGYEDGTENPKDEAAQATAIVADGNGAPPGSSFVAVQQWLHDFEHFESMGEADRDAAIGRRRHDNAELTEAPATAHVRRTAQEDFEPPAFMFRRSMPWVEGDAGGLLFVAFGHSFYAFDAALRRMAGIEDGVVDALFGFSRPLTGAYFWCPPLRDGRLDLSALGS